MTVYFIGAGPGAADLLTIRALNTIKRCPVFMYAGALVPDEVVAEAPADAKIVDTQDLTLEQIVAELKSAHEQGLDVARLHSGDLSFYSALAEQTSQLDLLGIDWQMIPGVPAFAAVSAELGQELTVPGVAQTVILTRFSRRASAMPAGEELAGLAAHGATLVLHLGVQAMDELAELLAEHYGWECPVAVVARATWPDQQVLRGTLADIAGQVNKAGIKRTATIVVGQALNGMQDCRSHLYSCDRDRNNPESSHASQADS